MSTFEMDLASVIFMNCDEARRILDLARDGEPGLGDVAGAQHHLDSCPECREVVERRAAFDERVSQLCREVVPPPRGRDDLLAALAAARTASTSAASVGDSPGGRKSRRRLLWAAAACAVVLVGAGGAFLWLAALPVVGVSQLIAALSAVEWRTNRPAEAPRWRDGRTPPLPTTMNTRAISTSAQRLAVERVEAAVFFFQVRNRGAMVEAALAVVPASQLRSDSHATSFLAERPVQWGELCASSWVEGRVAYVCCVRGDGSDLERLRPPAGPSA